jgi:hypothetical protein
MERGELDRAGWVPHWHRVDIYIRGDWFDGEERVCSGIQDTQNNNSPKEISVLHCPPEPNGPFAENFDSSASISSHNLSILFWGRISRPGISYIDELSGKRFAWNCTRKEDRFVCRAIN